MQIKIFTIPIMGGEKLLEEMNVFLRSVADVVCFPPTSLPKHLGSEVVAGEKHLQRPDGLFATSSCWYAVFGCEFLLAG